MYLTILTRPKEGSYGPYNDLSHDIVTAAKQLAIDRAVREYGNTGCGVFKRGVQT